MAQNFQLGNQNCDELPTTFLLTAKPEPSNKAQTDLCDEMNSHSVDKDVSDLTMDRKISRELSVISRSLSSNESPTALTDGSTLKQSRTFTCATLNRINEINRIVEIVNCHLDSLNVTVCPASDRTQFTRKRQAAFQLDDIRFSNHMLSRKRQKHEKDVSATIIQASGLNKQHEIRTCELQNNVCCTLSDQDEQSRKNSQYQPKSFKSSQNLSKTEPLIPMSGLLARRKAQLQ